MIELMDVSKTYGMKQTAPVSAVRGASLVVEPGEFIIITGRSGSGKTTLLNLIAGLTRPTAGAVHLQGRDIWALSDKAQSLLRNRAIGFIFQFPSLLPSLTTLENVALPLSFGGSSDRATNRQRARTMLETVGLADKVSVYPRQLSAGQQQRVVIARALINQPQILLADEATSNLDEETEQDIMTMLLDVHRSMGVTILMISHTSQLLDYGTRSIEMAQGAIVRDSGKIPPATPVRAA